ncbi:MAG: peptidase M23 [Rhizobiales bacterium 62-47]|nr:M23 family metallopeptidase [Hyphomicrobiales bacterium]OJY10666.1 MAG: peptidase M23 [Rhizobiales bacterium 62-47]
MRSRLPFTDPVVLVLLSMVHSGAMVGSALANDLRLRMPVDCEVGRTCIIQNYVDVDPSAAATDYTCGTLTYDGHNGTDFRLPSLAAQRAKVNVLAAADGRVLRIRDGVDDVAVTGGAHGKVDGRECGNGVIVGHAENWETQYCHMAKGTIRVKPGDSVVAGDPLGQIGLSGLTEYPHLHFTLRHDGKIADPFAYGRAGGACSGDAENLWDESVRKQLAYRPRTVLNTGFATDTVTREAIENGEMAQQQPAANSPAIVAFVRAIGLKQGDVQSLTLRDPAGHTLAEHHGAALDKNKAQVILFTGKKRTRPNWESGTYTATYVVSHDEQTLLEQQFQFELR